MSVIKLIVSDLELADGSSILDGFGDRQQSAFEGLLRVASVQSGVDGHANAGIPLSQADDVELIINGDCFDFLVTTPFDLNGVVDQAMALHKLERIIAAHRPFFMALRAFIEVPGRSVTFITGNHDIELCFVEVRRQICSTIVGTASDSRVRFCETRFYRPLPDVYIEHGNYYDFWNHAIKGLWNEAGQPVNLEPTTITLPVGSWYFQHAANLISIQYAYFDHLEPSMNTMRQIALLCLLNPRLILETASLTMEMLSYPRKALANLQPGEEHNPVRMFEETMMDFVAFQEDMVAHKSDWAPRTEDMQISPEVLQEFAML